MIQRFEREVAMEKQKITYRFHNLVSDKAVQKKYIENQLIKNTVEWIFQQIQKREQGEIL